MSHIDSYTKPRRLLKLKAGHGTILKILETKAETQMKEKKSKDPELITF